ncbi:response regulator transcription factor [candidate division WOR-3 bacterium]|uniref:Response regulator transcription factor n=1 Tax=candidate division WOR-3 bacterium TaxID=2052148 RepID=A0A937XG75_UNCW3|nr:response regulator transcription factor [candidate division WOR-3 bacterium]
MSRLIAVVDDEPDIRDLVALHLKGAGFSVRAFPDATQFQKSLAGSLPDLVILDLMLPDADGIDVCKDMKRGARTTDIPIVMLTARGDELDRVLGLEIGADDYITKPFSPKELVARVKAVLRRRDKGGRQATVELTEGVVMDPNRYEVSVNGRKLELTTTEFKLLAILAERRGWVFSRDEILGRLWGDEKAVIDRTIDVHVTNLRRKLGKAGRLIENVRGVGYKLTD